MTHPSTTHTVVDLRRFEGALCGELGTHSYGTDALVGAAANRRTAVLLPTAFYIVVEDLLRAAIGKIDRELLAVDVHDGAIAKLRMSYVISDRIFRRDNARSSGGSDCII